MPVRIVKKDDLRTLRQRFVSEFGGVPIIANLMKNMYIYIPYAPCMEYLPTFTPKTTQM